VYLQSRVYLQNQQQYSCIVSNTLRAEPKAISIIGPDARILSNTNLKWIEICGIRFKESPQAPKVDQEASFKVPRLYYETYSTIFHKTGSFNKQAIS
jgi:hypothetical protein